MISARNARGPTELLMRGAGLEVTAVDLAEAAARKAESGGGRFDFAFAGAEQGQHVTD